MTDSTRSPSSTRDTRSTALEQLYTEDLREHADVPPVDTPEYRVLRERDRRRRKRATELLLDSLEASGTLSAKDLYHAAWLFNHGEHPAEARRTHELTRAAAVRGHRPARWLGAAYNIFAARTSSQSSWRRRKRGPRIFRQ